MLDIQSTESCLEEAFELSLRFPDLGDADVLEHIEFITGRKIHENSILARGILIAYDSQDPHKGMEFIDA